MDERYWTATAAGEDECGVCVCMYFTYKYLCMQKRRFGTLLLHLTDDVSRDGGVKVDGVVSKPLRAFVAFTTPALEGLANANLSAMAVLGVVLDTIHILVSLFASGHGARERFLITSIHAHGTEDGF